VPVAGKPLNAALPVASLHVGVDTVPVEGAVGVGGCSLITKPAEAGETHPEIFATIYVYVPAGIDVSV
jgi:hypothetical protein